MKPNLKAWAKRAGKQPPKEKLPTEQYQGDDDVPMGEPEGKENEDEEEDAEGEHEEPDGDEVPKAAPKAAPKVAEKPVLPGSKRPNIAAFVKRKRAAVA